MPHVLKAPEARADHCHILHDVGDAPGTRRLVREVKKRMRSSVLEDGRRSQLNAAELAVLFRQAGVPTDRASAPSASVSVDWSAFEKSAFDTFYTELEQVAQLEQLAYQRLDDRLSHIPAAFRTEHRSWYHPSSFAASVGHKRLIILAALLTMLAVFGLWMYMTDRAQSGSASTPMSHAAHGSTQDESGASADPSSASMAEKKTVSHEEHRRMQRPASAPGATVADPAGAIVGPISVELGEFFVRPTASTFSAGDHTLSLRNAGKVEHELMVIRTDRVRGAIDQMSSAELHDAALTSVHGLQPGDRQSADVALSPGTYILFCNLPGHFSGGQHATITVA